MMLRNIIPFVGRGAGGGAPNAWAFTSSSDYAPAGTPTQAKLSDGSGATYWGSNGAETSGQDIFLRADFGSAKTLSAVIYRAATVATGWNESYLNGAVIQHSLDGTTWTTATTISAASQTVDTTYTLPAPVSARYVQICSVYAVTPGNVGAYMAASEFRFS